MKVQKVILNFILRIEMFFVSFIKIKQNRVTFISLESNHLNSDFKFMYEKLNHQKYDIKLCLIHYHKNILGQFLYFLNCIKQLYYINTSRVVILHDNNYVVSHFKREGIIVLQVWHACGAIKKFGNVIKREYPISNYDYVLSTSAYWKKPYSEAFGVSEENVMPLGMPRTDELFDKKWIEEKKERLYLKYPQLKNKKIVLYAPTFRGNIYKGFSTISFDVQTIVEELGEDYIFIYKFHPLLGNYQLMKDNEFVINMNHEDTHELFTICDYLISDYSSIIFDYMILEKPMIFFTPDLESYMQNVGMFVDITKLGYPVCQDEYEILDVIKNESDVLLSIPAMKNKFFDQQDGQSTKRVVQFIESCLQ